MNLVVGFIDEHRAEHGVEPICTILSEAQVPIAVSTYYAAHSTPRPKPWTQQQHPESGPEPRPRMLGWGSINADMNTPRG